MNSRIDIFVPVLNRPENVKPLVESFMDNCTMSEQLTFIVNESDTEEIAAIQETLGAIERKNTRVDVNILCAPPDCIGWAQKINYAYKHAYVFGEWMLLGADDIRFHKGWSKVAAPHMTEDWGVIGTNDLGNASTIDGSHSTHPLVSRTYAREFGTIDGPGAVLVEHYHHNYVDNELVETAKARGKWIHLFNCIVEHNHPAWGKAKTDAVYALGQSRMAEDAVKWGLRKQLIAAMPREAEEPTLWLMVLAKDKKEAAGFFERNGRGLACNVRMVVNPESKHGKYASLANRFIRDAAFSADVLGIVHADTTFGRTALSAFTRTAHTHQCVTGMVGRDIQNNYVWSSETNEKKQQSRNGWGTRIGGGVSTLDSCSVFWPSNSNVYFDDVIFDDYHCCVEDFCLQLRMNNIHAMVPSNVEANHISKRIAWGDYSVYRAKLATKWSQVLFTTT